MGFECPAMDIAVLLLKFEQKIVAVVVTHLDIYYNLCVIQQEQFTPIILGFFS